MSSLPPRRGAYGFDAPYAPLLMALGGACLLALSVTQLWLGEGRHAKKVRLDRVQFSRETFSHFDRLGVG
jgi:hypothetical protein